MTARTRSRGFTLIELIMIIVIGAVLTIGIVKFTHQQIKDSTKMRDYLTALNLARLKMSIVNNTDYASMVASTSTTLPAEASFPGFITQRVVSAETTGAPNGVKYKRIDIKVDYTGGTFTNPIIWLITYRESNITFGDGI